jgi:hypothetical protein
MITVNLQSGGTYSIEENIVANIKANSNGSEIVVVEAEQLRSIFSSQSPATVAGLSPYFLSLTDIKGAEVEATIGYSGLVNTIDFVFNIGAGRWSKLTDNGSNSLTAIAQFVQNITVGQAITSETGYARVSSVSYTYPSNTIYLNALRIKDVTALGFYGGSLVKYDEGGADLAEYEVGIVPATLVTQINATGGGGSGWGLTGNAGTDPATNFIGTTDGEDLIIQPNAGNVGIGTTAPATKVELRDGQGSDVGVINVGFNEINIAVATATTTQQLILNSVTGTNTYTCATDHLFSGGNVGIGTPTPTEKLDVVGNIQLTGALITVPQYATPLTGTTVTSDGSQQLIVNPAGTLLALTIDFPATPVDGQRFDIACTQIITGLTLTAAATILGTLTTFAAANATASWIYSTGASAWVRQG